MTIQEFKQSLEDKQPPKDASVYLQSLWFDASGDWNKAHHLIDKLLGNSAAALHAYLHRVEGDNRNANYWYQRAGKRMPDVSLKEEWEELVNEFIDNK